MSFEKDGLEVVVDLLYGSDVTRKYTPDQSDLPTVLQKVFTRQWDDIWLSLSIATSQRSLLLEYGNNYMMQIKQVLQAEPLESPLINSFRKFVADPNDMGSLSTCISIIKQKRIFKTMPVSTSSPADSLDTQIADCLYVSAVAFPKYKKVKSK